MNLRHLEWFCHAYETCPFAKAAERASNIAEVISAGNLTARKI